ncbi:MAG: hypothetical protein GWM88_16935 [Pseudomonadales bacterium]|nr:SPOR domain-containing protein [Pseudomonadales bacterium]NIX09617.1 hypothetical protein [Pseudomonadales bacterium]
MANDFANRLNPTTKRRASARPPSGARRRDKRFNGPSFAAGLLIGSAGMAVALNLADLQPPRLPTADATTEAAPPESVVFEFDQELRGARVEADPEQYKTDAGHAGAVNYLIQAAAYRAAVDADSLLARLQGMGLPAQSEAVQLDARTWFRVTVGPFDSQLEANRALTRLREIDLNALMMKQRLPEPG